MVSLNTRAVALSFLFQRLKWPVPMARWRAAKEIRNLLNELATRSSTTDALFVYLDKCKTESEVCEILTIVFLASSDARPELEELVSRIHCHSLLADIILVRTYGLGSGTGDWQHTHSSHAPIDFEGSSYFHEHKSAHVPPILVNNLGRLERGSGLPLLQHWAYEWEALRDKLGTHYTRYPHYFDDVMDARSGIMGQYWQRMRDIYLSAYLRTLAYAVSEWGMPQANAEQYCHDIVHGIAGLFDVDPSERPAWLSDIPEKFCDPDAEFSQLIKELVNAARTDRMILVSLNTPIALSVNKYAKLTLSAHLVTPDYELPDGKMLFEKMLFMSVRNTFELKGLPEKFTLEEMSTDGIKGNEVPVCGSLLPIPFGTWQSDYMSVGLTIPAPYTIPYTELLCTSKCINTTSDGNVVSKTMLWNDNWKPPHPKGGSTRCGTVTMLDQNVLEKAKQQLGRKLAYFIWLHTWDREDDYGDYSKSERTFFLLDSES